MKVNNIQQKIGNVNQKIVRGLNEKISDKVANDPKLASKIAGLAGCSVIAQKLVMSAGEIAVAPFVDIGVGKAITKITGETDGRTNQSSKVQAVRTVAQTTGGTITGVIIRYGSILAATALAMKAGKKVGNDFGGKVAKILTESDKGNINPNDIYKYSERMSSWGKSLGGALAVFIMMFTNFIIDAPFINSINKKLSSLLNINTAAQNDAKEVK